MPPRRFCDDLGLDVISAGGTITWAMECGEKGLLEGVGERVVLLKRLFNEREGWAPAEDTLPERFLSEPLPEGSPSGGAALTRASLQRMIRGYYRARGLT